VTRERLLELVQRDEDAWNAHDPDRLAALFAPGLEYRSVTLPEPLHGREAFRDLAARYMRAFPDLRISNDAVATGEDTVVIEWRITGTHLGPLDTVPPTGRTIEIRGCGVVRVDADGLMAEIDEYWNLLSLLRQLGPRALALGGAREGAARLRGVLDRVRGRP
jgi:steroid delta-isomerase-like uncharacterized protein